MGGFTKIRLKNVSDINIKIMNIRLKMFKVPSQYSFYSELDVLTEYEYFKKGLGVFREDLFPKEKINSFEDFKLYWNPRALGEMFCPKEGTLVLDCYFGRTSKATMKKIAKFLIENIREIGAVEGSFDTFAERSMTKLEMQILREYKLI